MKAMGSWRGAIPLLAFMACAAPQSRDSDPAPVDPVAGLIQEAQGMVKAEDFATGASVLQALGLRGQAYDRMDEVLYWLGRARAGEGKLERAERCFSLLERYYPRSPLHFAELEEERARIQSLLKQRQERSLESEAQAAPDVARDQDGPTVSNVFMETNVRQALSDISAQTGVRIVPDPLVQGLVTAEFTEVPLDQALEQVLAPLGLVARKYSDYYLVGSPTRDSPAYLKLTETRRYQPQHLDAADIPALLPATLADAVNVNELANVLTLTAAPSQLERFETDLALIDQPVPQVLIEAQVVEMGRELRRALGIEWSVLETRGFSELGVARVSPVASFDPALQLDFLRDAVDTDFSATLRALESEGVVKVRANPSVATLSGEEATIRIGREAYFSLLQGSAAFPFITLEKISTGTTLNITPLVGSSSQITTLLHTEVSDVTGTGVDDLPVTSLRTVDTRLRVGSGETIAVGGLVQERSREESQGVPGLSRIPFVGALFREDTRQQVDTEVVIFLTPYVLIDPETFLTL